MDQHAHPGLGLKKPRGYGKADEVQIAAPVVSGDGGQVGIPEERLERDQLTIVGGALVRRFGFVVNQPSRSGERHAKELEDHLVAPPAKGGVHIEADRRSRRQFDVLKFPDGGGREPVAGHFALVA